MALLALVLHACFKSESVYIASAHCSSFQSLREQHRPVGALLAASRRPARAATAPGGARGSAAGAHRLSSGRPLTFSRTNPSTPPSRRISAAPVPMKPAPDSPVSAARRPTPGAAPGRAGCALSWWGAPSSSPSGPRSLFSRTPISHSRFRPASTATQSARSRCVHSRTPSFSLAAHCVQENTSARGGGRGRGSAGHTHFCAHSLSHRLHLQHLRASVRPPVSPCSCWGKEAPSIVAWSRGAGDRAPHLQQFLCLAAVRRVQREDDPLSPSSRPSELARSSGLGGRGVRSRAVHRFYARVLTCAPPAISLPIRSLSVSSTPDSALKLSAT